MNFRDNVSAILTGYSGDKLSLVFEQVARLVDGGAIHIKSGQCLRDLTLEQMGAHLEAEVRELRDDGDIEEAGDIIDILVHWCLRKGWTPAAVVNAALRKLALRFEVPAIANASEIAPNHELKTWPEFFRPLSTGEKTFELRYDDRGYDAGDRILFREWDPHSERYTGDELLATVTYVLTGMGLEPGYVALALSIQRTNEQIVNLLHGLLSAEARERLRPAI